VQAPNDGSFNLGPSRFYIRLKGGGIAEYPYNSVTLSPSDDHGPAGLLFKAPPEVLSLLAFTCTFTRFTRTKVQILTPLAARGRWRTLRSRSRLKQTAFLSRTRCLDAALMGRLSTYRRQMMAPLSPVLQACVCGSLTLSPSPSRTPSSHGTLQKAVFLAVWRLQHRRYSM
jgi:hypothetical protein